MSKISLIIQREYITRVRKRSFIIMSVLGPVLFAGMMIVPAWLSQVEEMDVKRIAVVDSSNMFRNVIPETEILKFDYLENVSLETLKKTYAQSGYYGILYISHIVTYDPNSVILYSDKQPNLATKLHISNAMEEYIKSLKLSTYDIKDLDMILRSIKTDINIRTIKLSENGREKESSTGIAMAVGYAGGLLIYMFIFIFGAQVMRGVIEEKTNRIVEVVISSVRPFQLMMGKITGIALVGLSQFLIWTVSTFLLVSIAKAVLFPELNLTSTEKVLTQDIMSSGQAAVSPEPEESAANMQEVYTALEALKNIDFLVMIGSFLFYFLGGYLLYASLFAAVGAAVDNETDTQQFMLPITVPLILAIFVMISAINSPGSPVSFWFSLIPFTSSVVMMARIPFGVPVWEVVLSMAILVLTFLGTTWMAAKIYRTGILMYGKKVSYRELAKWIRYKG
jgi:ABC-2 type transport system permease protein